MVRSQLRRGELKGRKSRPPERNGDEPRSPLRFHTQQHASLAIGAGISQRFADLSRSRHRLACYLENHVARTEAKIGTRTGRVDLGNHHARLVTARRQGQPQARTLVHRNVAVALRTVPPAITRRVLIAIKVAVLVGASIGAGLALSRQLAERQIDRLISAFPDNTELDVGTWRHAANAARELASVLHPFA